MTTTTTTTEKAARISARIVALMAEGMTVQQALDAVLGAGTAAAIASDLYDALRRAH